MARKRKKDKDSYPALKREMTVFLIFLGLLITGAGLSAYYGLQDNPHQLWGLDRHVAIGVPTILIGALLFAAGIGLGVTGYKAFAVLGGVSSVLLTGYYYVFMFSATGEVPINLISLILIAIPVLLWSRVGVFLNARRPEQAE